MNEGSDEAPPAPSGDSLAESLRGFGPLGLVAMLVVLVAGNHPFVPLSALLVLLWVWRSQTPWREIGFSRPRSWIGTVLLGIVLGIVLKLVMKSVVMPLLGADPINRTYHYLVGNQAALPATVYRMIVGAGFGEETVFRGYLFERLTRLLGTRLWARVAIVVLTSALFGMAHYSDQGVAGVQQAAIVGLVLGTIYAATRRIWLPMVAHAAFDLTALAIIYWDLETQVARFFFK